MIAGAVAQGANDLAIVVNALCEGMAVWNGIVDGRENAAAVEEGMDAAHVNVLTDDDLADGIDAVGKGAHGGLGIIESSVSATAKEEAVSSGGITVIPDDLACRVDTERSSASGCRRGEGIVIVDCWLSCALSCVLRYRQQRLL
jgi:hypothetical protein